MMMLYKNIAWSAFEKRNAFSLFRRRITFFIAGRLPGIVRKEG